jgi:anthranilate synthase/aminodeoxychorismate synthase-like glutamine amidotransferase|tara:strand:- start:29 stop:655 length:627 start_codon:yes stop_codon:yes gene_type:complete
MNLKISLPLICSNFYKMHVLLFDNHDSFSWNLSHDLERAGANVVVVRPEELKIEIDKVLEPFDAIVLSPGPGMPSDAPGLMDVLASAVKLDKPILGVCLGLQAIVEFFGGELENMNEVLHGRVGVLEIVEPCDIFENIHSGCEVGHYHSWCAVEASLPSDLSVLARSNTKIILAISHKSRPIVGLQFHPESILTTEGRLMLKNWVNSI